MKTFERMLFAAIRAGDEHLANLCCDAGADLNARDATGMTPLDAAVISRNQAITSLLLRRGADPRAVTRDGVTALGLASAANDVATLRSLSAFCAGFEAPVQASKGCLHIAIESGATEAVQYLLLHGADANAMDESGNSLLQTACSLGRPDLVRSLLAHGADPAHQNFLGRTVLKDAMATGFFGQVIAIAERLPTSALADTLHTADFESEEWSEEGAQHQSPVRRMARAATHVRYRVYLLRRKMRDRLRVLAEKRRPRGELTPDARLKSAIHLGATSEAAAALADGANPNVTTDTGCPAIVAAAAISGDDHVGVWNLVTELIDRGAAIDSRHPTTGETVLHVACRSNQTLTVIALLQRVAGRTLVNASDALLNRPIHLATVARNPDIIGELYRAGADTNPINRDGMAPLHLAAAANDATTATALLRHDANVALRTTSGKTVKQCIGPGIEPQTFSTLLDAETTRRRFPSIFSGGHPLAAMATSSLGWTRLR